MASIEIPIPEWLNEEIIAEIERIVLEKIKDAILYNIVEDIAMELNLTEKDLENFEKTRDNVWKKIFEKYKKEGLIK